MAQSYLYRFGYFIDAMFLPVYYVFILVKYLYNLENVLSFQHICKEHIYFLVRSIEKETNERILFLRFWCVEYVRVSRTHEHKCLLSSTEEKKNKENQRSWNDVCNMYEFVGANMKIIHEPCTFCRWKKDKWKKKKRNPFWNAVELSILNISFNLAINQIIRYAVSNKSISNHKWMRKII